MRPPASACGRGQAGGQLDRQLDRQFTGLGLVQPGARRMVLAPQWKANASRVGPMSAGRQAWYCARLPAGDARGALISAPA